MKMRQLLVGLWLISLLSACQSIGTPTLVSNGDITPQTSQPPTAAISPTATIAPSQTPLLATATAVEQGCFAQLDALPQQDRPAGTLVLADLYGSGHYSLLDVGSMEESELGSPNGDLEGLITSPDHHLMQYDDLGGDRWQRVVATLQGEVARIPLEHAWSSVAWLDNDHLVFSRTTDSFKGESPDSTLRVIDPRSGAQRTISLNLPNEYYYQHPSGNWLPILSVNPDITKVVYFSTENGGRKVIWDLQSNRPLASLPYQVPSDPTMPPPDVPFFDGWSADGSQFISTSPLEISSITGEPNLEELFRIGLDGEITQLTHFSDSNQFVRITLPEWSPDGKRIAFWLETSDKPDQKMDQLTQQLAILDVETGKIANTCLAYGDASYSYSLQKPVWAPDGRHLAVETRTPSGGSITNLLDIQQDTSVVLKEGLFPVAWLVGPSK